MPDAARQEMTRLQELRHETKQHSAAAKTGSDISPSAKRICDCTMDPSVSVNARAAALEARTVERSLPALFVGGNKATVDPARARFLP